MGHRPDRIVLWAVVLGAVLILIAATSSQAQAATIGTKTLVLGTAGSDVSKLQTELKRLGFLKAKSDSFFGKKTRTAIRRYQRSRCLKVNGKADRKTLNALRLQTAACGGGSPGAVTAGQSTTLTSQLVQFGSRVLSQGATGDDVTVLQQLLGIPQTGAYNSVTAQAVTKFQAANGLTADGVTGQLTAAAIGNKMTQYVATWYGPGLYGNKTACGQVLTADLQGTAHRTLACGAKVTFFYNGRFRTVPVVDRGPTAANLAFDLTEATAKSLGLVSTATLRAAF